MGSKTRQIARNKARNRFVTDKNGSGKFKAQDGRTISRFTGGAIYFTAAMDSPRNNPVELKRMDEKKKAARILEAIAKYKLREKRKRSKK